MKMKEIRLLKLHITAFKGLRNYVFEPIARSCTVLGRNEAYKTTLADAESWLLTDKDSSGNRKFDVKDSSVDIGETLAENVDVEAVYLINGEELKLRRVYKEVWGTTRGNPEERLKSHTNDYFVNDESGISERRFREVIAEKIADPKVLQLLIMGFFNDDTNTSWGWQKRRDILFEMGGNPSDEDVLNANEKLRNLAIELRSKKISIDAFKKIIKDQLTKINKQYKEFQPRIDENEKKIPDIKGIDVDVQQAGIRLIDAKIKEKNHALLQIEVGGIVAKKNKELSLIESQKLNIETKYRGKAQKEIDEAEAGKKVLSGQLDEIYRKQADLKYSITSSKKAIEKATGKREELRTEWIKIDKEEFVPAEEDFCELIKKTCPKALVFFNTDMAVRAGMIIQRGEELNEQMKIAKDLIEGDEKEIRELTLQEGDLQKKIAALDGLIEGLKNQFEQFAETEEYKALLIRQSAINREIITLRENSQPEIDKINQEISELETEKEAHQVQINKVKFHAELIERNQELDAQRKTMSMEIERLQSLLNDCIAFNTTKVNLTEEKINSLFKITKWKMFERKVDGEINDQMCIATYKGNKYSTNLNNGHRILVDLDCKEAIARHYGLNIFSFVDNTESVSVMPYTGSQLIKLEHDRNLKPGELVVKYDDDPPYIGQKEANKKQFKLQTLEDLEDC